MHSRTITLDNELSLETIYPLLASFEPLWRASDLPQQVHLDLEGVKFIWPLAITLLVTNILRLRQQGVELAITPPAESDVQHYLERIDFYAHAGLETNYPWHRRDPSGRFLPVVQVQSEEEGEDAVVELLEILARNVVGVDAVYGAIQYAFLEVVNNVFHHAQSPTQAVICAQSYPKLNRVELAVVDSGRGIPASLHGNPELVGRFQTAAEAIQLAIQPRVTGRPERNTGEGLFFTLEFIKANGGNAGIYSQDGAFSIHKGQSQAEQTPFWPGTFVALRFRTDRIVDASAIFNQYAPPEQDFDWLFDGEIAS